MGMRVYMEGIGMLFETEHKGIVRFDSDCQFPSGYFDEASIQATANKYKAFATLLEAGLAEFFRREAIKNKHSTKE